MDSTLAAQARAILGSPRIRGKIVVLCEGDPLPLDPAGGPPSPQMYGRLEHTPDASFYAQCVPQDWQGWGLPRFFTCGGRSQVLEVFGELLTIHKRRPDESYLSPDKLFALVDLDLQNASLPACGPCATTEDAHALLYSDGLVRPDVAASQRIWVTALVHKEAFFVLPGAEANWRDSPPYLDGAPLVLRDLYAKIAEALPRDGDLLANLPALAERLQRFSAASWLDTASAEGLRGSWLAASQRGPEPGLVRALLAVGKVKPFWLQIGPGPELERDLSPSQCREQLELNLARWIAERDPAEHPLAGFFAWLRSQR